MRHRRLPLGDCVVEVYEEGQFLHRRTVRNVRSPEEAVNRVRFGFCLSQRGCLAGTGELREAGVEFIAGRMIYKRCPVGERRQSPVHQPCQLVLAGIEEPISAHETLKRFIRGGR